MIETPYDPDARRETPLAMVLKERIRQHGPLSMREYMAACLYDPDYGYYRTRSPLGRQGDFVTAPEVSQIFGELIGLWSAVVWQQMGSPAAFDLIEIGPGCGTLMRDALRAVRRVPGFLAAARVRLVEVSEALASAQRATLADAGVLVTWAANLDELTISGELAPPAIVIANELLDCDPRDQLIRLEGTWLQRTVALDARGRLSFSTRKPDAEIAALLPELDRLYPAATEGDIVEPSRHDWLLDGLVRHASLAALFIDYGHTEPLIGDTLQAVREHRYEHPLTSPGEADITMQVDFASLCRAIAQRTPFATDGPVTQGEFLGALGAIERASHLMSANPSRAGEIEAGIARLMSPTGMGTRFKAIGLRSRSLPSLPGLAPMDIARARK